MASTYDTNIGLEKPGTGEQDGTWGDTLNTNFDLIGEAINGIGTVTQTSSHETSGGTNTLPISDGASSTGRNKFIEIVDDGGSAPSAKTYLQLTPNDAEKVCHIRNSSTYNVYIFQGTYNASNDYELPAGKDAVLKFDGAGTGAVVTNVFTNLEVGALSAAGVLNIAGDFEMSGANPEIHNQDTDGYIAISSGSSVSNGLSLTMFAPSHATLANDFRIRSGSTDVLYYNDSSTQFVSNSNINVANAAPQFSLTDTDTGATAGISGASSAGSLAINVDQNSDAADSRFIVTVDGNTVMTMGDSNDLTVLTTNLELTGGLKVSSGSEYLDVYSESTFTPAFADAASGGNEATVASANGRKVIIGALVTIWVEVVNINTTGLTTSNTAYLTGLGTTMVSSTMDLAVGSCVLDRVSFGAFISPIVTQNTSYLTFTEMATGAADAPLKVNDFTSGTSDFYVTISYEAA